MWIDHTPPANLGQSTGEAMLSSDMEYPYNIDVHKLGRLFLNRVTDAALYLYSGVFSNPFGFGN